MTLAELARWVTALLAMASAFGWLHLRVWHLRHERSVEDLMLNLAVSVSWFGVAWATWESMVNGAPLVRAHAIFPVAFVAIQIGLWHNRPRRTRKAPDHDRTA